MPAITIFEFIVLGLLTAAMLGFVVYVHVANHKRRSSMTPEQRAAEDDEVLRDLNIL